jgi:hypothetical protein
MFWNINNLKYEFSRLVRWAAAQQNSEFIDYSAAAGMSFCSLIIAD